MKNRHFVRFVVSSRHSIVKTLAFYSGYNIWKKGEKTTTEIYQKETFINYLLENKLFYQT